MTHSQYNIVILNLANKGDILFKMTLFMMCFLWNGQNNICW